jgi:hypothetical protein
LPHLGNWPAASDHAVEPLVDRWPASFRGREITGMEDNQGRTHRW